MTEKRVPRGKSPAKQHGYASYGRSFRNETDRARRLICTQGGKGYKKISNHGKTRRNRDIDRMQTARADAGRGFRINLCPPNCVRN